MIRIDLMTGRVCFTQHRTTLHEMKCLNQPGKVQNTKTLPNVSKLGSPAKQCSPENILVGTVGLAKIRIFQQKITEIMQICT